MGRVIALLEITNWFSQKMMRNIKVTFDLFTFLFFFNQTFTISQITQCHNFKQLLYHQLSIMDKNGSSVVLSLCVPHVMIDDDYVPHKCMSRD